MTIIDPFAGIPTIGMIHPVAFLPTQRPPTPIAVEPLARACDCEARRDEAAADPERRISAHRTSRGHVVYYRCYCGRPGVAIIRVGHWPTAP